jgi:hypothetical protein
VVGIHLAVTVDLDDDLSSKPESLAKTRDHRRAHSPVVVVSQQPQPPVALCHCRYEACRVIRRCIVHDDDMSEISREPPQHALDLSFNTIGRHYRSDWTAPKL